MKLLVLVIACKGGVSDEWLSLWRERKYPDWVTVRYMFLDPDAPEKFIEDGDSFVIRGHECHIPGVWIKTRASMKHCLETMEFDMLLRTNTSSFFKFDELLTFLKTLPTTNHMAGPVIHDPVRWYPSGCGYIMTRDVVEKFVEYNREDHFDDKIGYEDTETGIFMHFYNIPFTPWKYNSFHPDIPVSEMKGFHLRFRAWLNPERRDLDIKGFAEAVRFFG